MEILIDRLLELLSDVITSQRQRQKISLTFISFGALDVIYHYFQASILLGGPLARPYDGGHTGNRRSHQRGARSPTTKR